MGTAERRTQIMRALCRRRCDTIRNLANEFSVSERTVLRDIEALSVTEPIYTKQGKYGGVYVIDDYNMSHAYMSEEELSVLNKLLESIDSASVCKLNTSERFVLKNIISQYTKPIYKKGEM